MMASVKVTHMIKASLVHVALILISVISLISGPSAFAEHYKHAELEVYASLNDGVPRVHLYFKPDQGWHLYWRNPGDSGATLKAQWTIDGVVATGELEWPAPEVITLGPITNYGYSDPFILNVDFLQGQKAPHQVVGELEWLVCREECIPDFASISAEFKPVSQIVLPAVEQHVPQPLGEQLQFRRQGEVLLLALPKAIVSTDVRFFPFDNDQIQNGSRQIVRNGELELRPAMPPPTMLSGVLKVGQNSAYTIQAVASVGATTTPPTQIERSLLAMLFFAWLGGLILNVMPCVLPVIGIKLFELLEQQRADRLRFSVGYTAGVVTSMVALALVIVGLRSLGEAVGWGVQLQSPFVVYLLTVLFFLLGLNLLGVFHVGQSLQRLAGKLPATGAFFDGLVTVMIATPCTAPFMAGAIGYALTQPTIALVAIFVALGLGVATPLALASGVPLLSRLLPKPGHWMEMFKQLMAFPMFATSVWLLSILAKQGGVELLISALLAFIVIALASLLWGKTADSALDCAMRRLCFTVLFLGGSGSVYYFAPAMRMSEARAKKVELVERYSPARLEQLRDAGRTILLDATADWCITCQVNKRVVIKSSAVQHAFEDREVVLMEADWTNADAEITALLEQWGRAGVPLNVVYHGKAPGKLLPPLLTESIVLDALKD